MSGLSAEDLADYKARLEASIARLEEMADSAVATPVDRTRLRGKVAGFSNALDMLRGYA